MADTKLRARSAIQLLKEDHDTVKELFERFEDLEEGADARKSDLFERIKDELTVHAQIEEEIFYPAISELDEEKVNEALEAHQRVKDLLRELSAITPEDESFDEKMDALCENVESHAEDEEKELFALFGKLPRAEREEITRRLADRKREISGEGSAG